MARADDEVPVKKGEVLDGRYRVERIVGAGGMGFVVSARHIELGTVVALKILQPKLMSDSESAARFQREARAAVRMKGEHTVRVTDVGKLKTGVPYMVMEFLAGQDLGHVLEARGALPVADAVAYVLQASEGIAEAHSLGIIHRDLKPQNLFLTRRIDGTPLVKVLDFGLVKALDAREVKGVKLTHTTSMIGSPVYMSPEQVRSSKEIDTRTDIWSLGICLYELLTAVVPFGGNTAFEVCAKVLSEPPVPPDELRRDVPEGLSRAILRCLEKDPSLRCADVAELAAAIEPYGPDPTGDASARVRSILHTTEIRMESEPPISDLGTPILGAKTEVDARLVDTRTAATLDSHTRKEHFRYAAAVGTGLVVLVSALGLTRIIHGGAGSGAPAPSSADEDVPGVAPSSVRPARPPSTGERAPAEVSPIPEIPPTTSTPAVTIPRPPQGKPSHRTPDAGITLHPESKSF